MLVSTVVVVCCCLQQQYVGVYSSSMLVSTVVARWCLQQQQYVGVYSSSSSMLVSTLSTSMLVSTVVLCWCLQQQYVGVYSTSILYNILHAWGREFNLWCHTFQNWIEILNKFYLFWWKMSIVFFSPQFGIHLQYDIIKIGFPRHLLNIVFSNMVSSMLPVSGLGKI